MIEKKMGNNVVGLLLFMPGDIDKNISSFEVLPSGSCRWPGVVDLCATFQSLPMFQCHRGQQASFVL